MFYVDHQLQPEEPKTEGRKESNLQTFKGLTRGRGPRFVLGCPGKQDQEQWFETRRKQTQDSYQEKFPEGKGCQPINRVPQKMVYSPSMVNTK